MQTPYWNKHFTMGQDSTHACEIDPGCVNSTSKRPPGPSNKSVAELCPPSLFSPPPGMSFVQSRDFTCQQHHFPHQL